MADLPWIKLYTGDWRKLVAGMSAAARAGMVDLVFTAWDRHGDDGAPACALPDDDEVLMRAAGLTEREWKAARADIRRRWRPHPGAAGYVQCPQIAAWYAEGHAAHASASVRGAKGGREKARRARERASSASGPTASSATGSGTSRATSPAVAELLAQGVGSQKSEVRGDYVPDAYASGDVGPPAAGAAAAGAAPGGALAAAAAADDPEGAPDPRVAALLAEHGLSGTARALAKATAPDGPRPTRREAAGLTPIGGPRSPTPDLAERKRAALDALGVGAGHNPFRGNGHPPTVTERDTGDAGGDP